MDVPRIQRALISANPVGGPVASDQPRACLPADLWRFRSLLLGTAVTLAYGQVAVAADRIHLGFDGYRSATNDYCINASSVQGYPQIGLMWRFSKRGALTSGTTFLAL